MKKLLYTFLGMSLMFTGTAYALPFFQSNKTIIPTDSNQDLGTTTAQTGQGTTWRKIYIQGADGCLTLTSNLITPSGVACGSGSGGSGTFPFDTFVNYNSTSSKPIGFLNGLFSTASSTFNSALWLPALTQGFLGVSPTGLVYTFATSTIKTSQITNDSGFNTGTVTSVASTFPILGGTFTTSGTLTFGGLSTSSPAVIGNIPYFSGVNTFANVATGTITGSTGISLDNSTRSAIGGSVQITNTGVISGSCIGITTCSGTNPLAVSTLYDAWTHPFRWVSATTSSGAFGTTTVGVSQSSTLTLASSTAPQLAFSSGAGVGLVVERNSFGTFYWSTTTVDGLSTSTIPAMFLDPNGYLTLPALGVVGCAQFTVTGKVTNTGTACGSGGGTSAFEIATTSNIALGQITYIAQVAGRTTLASVATSTASCAGFLTCTTFNILGSSPVTFTALHDEFPTHPYLGASATTSTMAIGTTTISAIAQVTVASSTKGAFAIGDNTPGDPLWVMRNASGNLSFSTTTVDGTATTTTSAATFNSSGVSAMTIGTTTGSTSCSQATLKNGSLCLGGGGDSSGNTGTSTITMAKIQINGLNTAGAPVCLFVNSSNAFSVNAGLCPNF